MSQSSPTGDESTPTVAPLSTDSDRTTVGTYVRWFAAALSVASAAIHYGYAPHHLQEDWAHGWFFVIIATAQLGFAFLVVTRPTRWLWSLAALLNIGIIGTWVVSRTAGLPFGPQSLRKEAVGTADLVSTVLEAAVILLAIIAIFAPSLMDRELRDRMGARFTTGALSGVALLAAFVMLTPTYTDAHAGDGHAHDSGSVLVGDTPCEKAGPAASPGQENTDAEGHSHRGPTAQQQVSPEDRQTLIDQQQQARDVALRFPTVADAEAAGYRMSTVYVPCIGAHYTNTRLAIRFDPSRPSELLYDGTKPDSKIVGLSFLVWHPNGPPEGFAGPNDSWHQHNFNGGLCLKGGVVVGAEALTQEECAARGGAKLGLEDIWMVHDWVVPGWECSWGVFAGECPELGGVTGRTAWDTNDGSVADPLQAIGK